eukprot:SM000134S26941  [mRNA]  locus=s134:258339:270283:+ [translate_table: standard]
MGCPAAAPPLPPEVAPCSSWLRSFEGGSWLAHAAGGAVVVEAAPAPSYGGEIAADGFFRQVVDLAALEGGAESAAGGDAASERPGGAAAPVVRCVEWGGEDDGLLAAALGEAVHILEARSNAAAAEPTGRGPQCAAAGANSGPIAITACSLLDIRWRLCSRPMTAAQLSDVMPSSLSHCSVFGEYYHISPGHSRQYQNFDQTKTMWRKYHISAGSAPPCAHQTRVALVERLAEVPLAWQPAHQLLHGSLVLALQWTGSSDGILVAGGESVAMWQWTLPTSSGSTEWRQLWSARPPIPQSLVAAAASAKGLVATFGAGDKEGNNSGTVTIWRGGKQEELPKIGRVVHLQWSPQSTASKEPPLLLTCGADGAARLWQEVDITSSVMQQPRRRATKKAATSTFRMVAVVEGGVVDNVLPGNGAVQLRWAESVPVLAKADGPVAEQGGDVAPCDWLLGCNVQGDVVLWAVFRITSSGGHGSNGLAFRSPRVALWQCCPRLLPRGRGGSGMGNNEGDSKSLALLRCLVQRPGSLRGLAPTAIEVFECLQGGGVQWSRLWPPLAALGSGAAGKDILMVSSSRASGGAGKPAAGWRLATKAKALHGHHAVVVEARVHEAPGAAAAASLDASGEVIVWRTGPAAHMTDVLSANTVPQWLACRQLHSQRQQPASMAGRSDLRRLAWLPWMGPAGRTILLLGHDSGIDVVCLSSVQSTAECEDRMICALAQSTSRAPVESVLVAPITEGRLSKFLVLALSDHGRRLDAWELVLRQASTGPFGSGSEGSNVDSANDHPMAQEISAAAKWYFGDQSPMEDVCMQQSSTGCYDEDWPAASSRLLASNNFADAERVCSAALVGGSGPGLVVGGALDDALIEGSATAGAARGNEADFLVTGHAEGSMILWDTRQCRDGSFVELGRFRAHAGAVERLAVTGDGARLATQRAGDDVRVWQADTCRSGSPVYELEGTIQASMPLVVALEWRDLGYGLPVLAVAGYTGVTVWAMSRAARWQPQGAVDPPAQRVSCVSWSNHGELVVGAGSQVLQIPWKNSLPQQDSGHKGLRSAAALVGGPLPSYHPEMLLHYLYLGQKLPARASLRGLARHLCGEAPRPQISLRELIAEGMEQGNDNSSARFGSGHLTFAAMSSVGDDGRGMLKPYDLLSSRKWAPDDYEGGQSVGDKPRSCTASGTSALFQKQAKEPLTSAEAQAMAALIKTSNTSIGLSLSDHHSLLAVVDALTQMDGGNQGRPLQLDAPAERFWLAVTTAKLKAKLKQEVTVGESLEGIKRAKQGESGGSLSESATPEASNAVVAWALQSQSHEELLSRLLPEPPTWDSFRALGAGFWLTNTAALRQQMEKLARAQFMEKRDAKDCALLYLALNRQTVLLGLMKLSKDERDKKLAEFLSLQLHVDLTHLLGVMPQDDSNQAAALKNAYVLLGQHRLHLAASFFLLGRDLSSAANVCARNLKDWQLALVVCHLVEEPSGPVSKQVIERLMLPAAADPWQASMLQWLLGNNIRALEEMQNTTERAVKREGDDDLGPDIGGYCTLLSSKPSLQGGEAGAEASAVATWAFNRGAYTFICKGLPLLALEHLSSGERLTPSYNAKATAHNGSGKRSTTRSTSSGASDELVRRMKGGLRRRLALQCLSSNILLRPSRVLAETLEDVRVISEHFGVPQEQLLLGLAEQALGAQHRLLLCNLVEALDHQDNASPGSATWRLAGACFQFMPKLMAASVISRGLFHPSEYRIEKAGLGAITSLAGELLRLADACHSGAAAWASKLGADVGEDGSVKALERARKVERLLRLLAFLHIVCGAWLARLPAHLLALMSCTLSRPGRELTLPSLSGGEEPWTWFQDLPSKSVDSIARCDVDQQETNEDQVAISLEDTWAVLGVALWSRLLDMAKQYLKPASAGDGGSGVSGWASPYAPSLLASPASRSTPRSPRTPVLGHRSVAPEEPGGNDGQRVGGGLEVVSSSREHAVTAQPVGDGIHDAAQELLRNLAKTALALTRQLASRSHMARGRRKWPLGRWLWAAKRPPTLSKAAAAGAAQVEFSRTVKEEPFYAHHDAGGFGFGSSIIASAISSGGLDSGSSTVAASPPLEPKHKQDGPAPPSGHTSDEMPLLPADSACQQLWRLLVVRSQLRTSLQMDGVSTATVDQSEDAPIGHEGGNRSQTGTSLGPAEDVFKMPGELLEAVCVNALNPHQVVVATNRKGLQTIDVDTHNAVSISVDNLWSELHWPHNGWAGSTASSQPPIPNLPFGVNNPAVMRPGVTLTKVPPGSRMVKIDGHGGEMAMGIPGYGGIGAWGMGWEDWEEDGYPDPRATMENMYSRALAAHPLRPLFLVGSNNTHVYLWEFGKTSATATYGVLPPPNTPLPYIIPSVSSVRFDHFGHRFVSAAADGTVLVWRVEVGGRSNVRPAETRQCFGRHASDAAFVGPGASLVAASGMTPGNNNLVLWDTLSPPSSSRIAVSCHEGGAPSLTVMASSQGASSSLIVSGGRAGDMCVHDLRALRSSKTHEGPKEAPASVWHVPKAHAGAIAAVVAIPDTPIVVTGSKEGDLKLWDVSKQQLLQHVPDAHDKRMFLNARGLGALMQCGVMNLLATPQGLLSCGADGIVKRFSYTVH